MPEQNYSGIVGFVRKHLDGEYSLGRSYWVHTVLIQVLMNIGVFMIIVSLRDKPARFGSAAILILSLLSVVVWAWGAGGTWASATRHVGRGGKSVWATLAKIAIVIGAISIYGQYSSQSKLFEEHWRVAWGAQMGPAYSIRLTADGRSVLVKGGINDGLSQELDKILTQGPGIVTVVLNSEGGWVREGVLMAKTIAKHGVNTYVEEVCASACTIAFLAGKDRAVGPQGKIGFHAFSAVGSDTSTRMDQNNVDQVYTNSGIGHDFIRRVKETPATGMWYPTSAELYRERVITRRGEGGEIAFLATDMRNRDQLDAGFRKVDLYRELANRFPSQYTQILDAAWHAVEDRKPDNEVIAAARAELMKIYPSLFRFASDSSLVLLNQTIVAQAKALQAIDPAYCAEFLYPTGRGIGVVQHLPKDLAAQELQVMATVIREADAAHQKNYSDKDVRRVFASLVKRLPPASAPRVMEALSPEKRAGMSSADVCTGTIEFFDGMQSLPLSERRIALRATLGALK